MNRILVSIAAGAFLSLLMFAPSACGKRNRAPVIHSLDASFETVAINEWDQLWVDVVEPDGDTMGYEWSCSRGTMYFPGPDEGAMDWKAPSSAGIDTVAVVVTDEHGASASKNRVITVTD